MPIKKSELYSSLWQSCDELRGGMDASQYKDYVLVLLFIKYVSDKYAGVPYAPITIPDGASFKDMVALKGKSDIGDQINKKIIGPLALANKLSDMPDFADATKLGTGKEIVDRLTNLIAIFENSALDFSKNRAEGDDILGDAYEYLMRHFATESGKSKGQFYTPAEVSRIMAQIIGIRDAKTTNNTTVYDPTCGSGSLLLKVGDEASANVTLYGQEKDAATSGLARMNMILHDNPTALIEQGNTLADPKFKDGDTLKTFDYVVANPPFSDKRWSNGIDPANDKYERFKTFGTPKGELEHIHYFCGNTEIPTDLEEREPQRAALYKATVALVRAYANIADELDRAGYDANEVARIKGQVDHYLDVREIVRKASGESLDLKPYEADMRHLIDTYIEAAEPRKISPFDNMGLMELIVKTGIANAIASQLGGLKGNKNAVAETIENNVRRTIIKDQLNDPAYYEKMSTLLDEIIADRKAKAIEYEEYLKRIAELAKRVDAGYADDMPDQLKKSPALRALYNNLKQDGIPSQDDPALARALQIDEAIKTHRPDGWRGVRAREQVIKAALYKILENVDDVERIFLIIKAQQEY